MRGFAADAVAAGAVAVLTDAEGLDELWQRSPPTRRLRVTGAVVVTDDPRAVLGDVAAEVYGSPPET